MMRALIIVCLENFTDVVVSNGGCEESHDNEREGYVRLGNSHLSRGDVCVCMCVSVCVYLSLFGRLEEYLKGMRRIKIVLKEMGSSGTSIIGMDHCFHEVNIHNKIKSKCISSL